ncbi:hypothetical protein [Alkalimarinus alittae]|uniref:Uncharacterized protein n=1 Tax=Alkalimarinus alittae TaxID=2961619 RepID=A0ABY6N569_9ALTE|nr:hypothetical protein [Alkalimarinus alittae]UZE97263.1 hypothetical protein NKI27_05800 [Alkalimarinus alittae]
MNFSFGKRTFGIDPEDTSVTFEVWVSLSDIDPYKSVGLIRVDLDKENNLIVGFLNESIDEAMQDALKDEVMNYSDTSGLYANRNGIKDMLLTQRKTVLWAKDSEYGLEECCSVCNYVAPSYSPTFCLSCIPE